MRLRVLLAFAAIFIVWGSTYLAIRYAVAEIPPLLTAGVRHLTAGCVLYAWARAKGYRASGREWGHSAVVGVLFFLVGHGTLHWAEQSVPSGLAALLVATEPLWIALLLAALGIPRLGVQTLVGALLGLAGVWALVGADVTSASALSVGAVAILVGAASWGAGVVYAQRAAMPQNPTLRTATTLLCGAAFLLVASLVAGDIPRGGRSVVAGSGFAGLSHRVRFDCGVHRLLLAARSLLRHAGVHAHIRESGSGGAPRLGVRR